MRPSSSEDNFGSDFWSSLPPRHHSDLAGATGIRAAHFLGNGMEVSLIAGHDLVNGQL